MRARLTVRSWAARLRGIYAGTLVCGSWTPWSISGLITWRIAWLAARLGQCCCSRLSRRSLFHRRTRSGGGIIRRLQALHLLARDRLPGMCCQLLLSRRERHRRRRRLRLCHNRSTGHRCWRRLHVVGRAGMRSQHTVRSGCYRSPRAHLRRRNFPCVHRNGRPRNRLTAGEGLSGNRRHRPGNASVHIRNVVDRGVVIDNGGVIDVGDGRGIYRRVADVDAIHVSTTYAVRRHIHFARAQRKPAHVAAESATSADEYD